MYYDLNIPWPVQASAGPAGSASTGSKKQGKGKQKETQAASRQKRGVELLSENEKKDLEDCLKMAIRLGYSTVAFNLLIPPGAYDSSTIAGLNPCYNAKPVFPDLDTRTATSSAGQKAVLQLSRVTCVLDESSIGGGKGNGSMFTSGNASSLIGYNLVAVQPLDSAAFTHVCLNLSSPGPSSVDIITLDLATSARLPFQLKRSMVLKAVADGTVLEICYGIAMRSSTGTLQPAERAIPKDARRNVIAGARELIRVTNGKGVILSSEVRRCMEIRGPLDLCNFGTILGLKPDQAKNTVSNNARLAVLRGHAHRGSYRGVISNPEVTITTKSSTGPDSAKRKRAAEDEAGR